MASRVSSNDSDSDKPSLVDAQHARDPLAEIQAHHASMARLQRRELLEMDWSAAMTRRHEDLASTTCRHEDLASTTCCKFCLASFHYLELLDDKDTQLLSYWEQLRIKDEQINMFHIQTEP